MKKIIKIRSGNSDTIKITWQLTTYCTYACEYCPPHFRTGRHLEVDIEAYKKFYSQLGRPIFLNLTGGECTTHPQIKELLAMARELGIKTKVDSNVVRTERFYREVGGLADVWCLTLHPSQHKFDMDKIKALTDQSFVIVYVMMDPKHWDLAQSWYEQLKSLENIKLILIKPVNNWAGADYITEWTQKQLEFLSTEPRWQFDEKRYNELVITHSWLKDTDTTAFYDDGSQGILDPDYLMKIDANNFYGWKCFSGKENLLIDPMGNITWSNCGILKLGNIKDFNVDDMPESVICNRTQCDCGSDIRADKYMIGKDEV